MKVLIPIVLVLFTLTASYAQGKKLRREEKRQIEAQNPIRDASGISETEESSVEIIEYDVLDNQVEHGLELMLSSPPVFHSGYYFFGERQQEAQRRLVEKLDQRTDPEDDVSLNQAFREFRSPTPEGIGTVPDEPILINSASKPNLQYQFQFTAHQAYPVAIDNIPPDIFDRPTVTVDKNQNMFRPEDTYKIKGIQLNEPQNIFSGSEFPVQTKPLSSYPMQSTHQRPRE